jgi:preprotein translocase subunit SecD
MQKINLKFLLLYIFLTFFSCAQKPSVRFILETNLAENEIAIKSEVIEILKARLKKVGFRNSVVAPVKHSSHIVVEVNANGDLENIRELLLRKGELKIVPVFGFGEDELNAFKDTLGRKNASIEDYLSKPMLKFSKFGIHLTQGNDTSAIIQELKKNGILDLLPKNSKLIWQEPNGFINQYSLMILDASEAQMFYGVSETNVYYDTYAPVIDFEFREKDIEIWSEMTKDNIGNQLAILIDDEFISTPVVQQQITEGNCDISGSFTVEEFERIASLLKSKPLPVKLDLLSESIIEEK